MKIFIIGATGFLGRDLVEDLSRDNSLVCFVRNIPDKTFHINKHIKFVIGDLNEQSRLDEASKGIDLLLHLATSRIKPAEDIIFIKNIIESAKKNKIKKIIFFSSMAATRTIKDEYGKSKLECERILIGSGVDYTIIRPSFVYGRDGMALFVRPLRMFPFFIPVIGNGEYKFSPVYKGDVVSFTKKAIKSKRSDRKIYELGGNEILTFNEMIQLIKKEKNIKKFVIHIPILISLWLNKLFGFTSNETIMGIYEDSKVDLASASKDFGFKGSDLKDQIKYIKI